MKKRFLPLTIALIAPLFFMSACGDGDSNNASSSKSARELAKAEAKAANCSVSLMIGTCTADGSAIASIKCNGIDLKVGTTGICPSGTKCITIDEGIGMMPYCVPEDEKPECVISTCDATDGSKIKKCTAGKFMVDKCKDDEVCRVEGKDDAGKDLAASCVKKPKASADPKEAEDNYDPCKTAGHTATVGDACSTDNKIALYTCQDGYVMTENCYPFSCEAVNPRKTIASWAADTDDMMMKMVINAMAGAMPDKDMHGCNAKAALAMMKDVLLIKIEM